MKNPRNIVVRKMTNEYMLSPLTDKARDFIKSKVAKYGSVSCYMSKDLKGVYCFVPSLNFDEEDVIAFIKDDTNEPKVKRIIGMRKLQEGYMLSPITAHSKRFVEDRIAKHGTVYPCLSKELEGLYNFSPFSPLDKGTVKYLVKSYNNVNR